MVGQSSHGHNSTEQLQMAGQSEVQVHNTTEQQMVTDDLRQDGDDGNGNACPMDLD